MTAPMAPSGASSRRAGGRWQVGLWLVLSVLAGCASGPNANPRDPLEPLNRGVYRFNEAVDGAVLKPVASAYRDVTPVRVRQGVGNFFGNLEDLWSFVNNALQFKGQGAIDSLKRVGINTFIGWGGLFDVATEMDIEKHTKDFGHTLGYWGLAPGPYLMLPLLGPSTLRDTVALPFDLKGDVVSSVAHVPTRNTATVVRAIDTRAGLLKATAMLEEAALDKYTFIREAFLQRRRSVIFDGNPPEEEGADTGWSAPDPLQPRAEARPDAAVRTVAEASAETLNPDGLPTDQKAKP